MKEVTIKSAGLTVFWTSGRSSLGPLKSALSEAGLGDFVPKKRTISQAAKAVAASQAKVIGGRNTSIFPLKDANGFECVHIEGGDKSNKYVQDFYMVIDDTRITECGGDILPDWRLNPMLSEELGIVDGSAIGSALVGYARHLSGICLRKNGGLYWIPEAHAKEWSDAASIFEDKSNSQIMVGRLEASASSIKAICNAFFEEVDAAIEEVESDIADENVRQFRYYENRLKQGKQLREKAALISGELSINVENIEEKLNSFCDRLAIMAAVAA